MLCDSCVRNFCQQVTDLIKSYQSKSNDVLLHQSMWFFLGGGRGKQSSTVILMVFLDTLRFRSFSFLSPIGVNEVDYSLYPNRKLQEQWLRSYLEAYKEYKGFGTEVSEKEVEVLYVQVNQFALVNSNLWI